MFTIVKYSFAIIRNINLKQKTAHKLPNFKQEIRIPKYDQCKLDQGKNRTFYDNILVLFYLFISIHQGGWPFQLKTDFKGVHI